MKLTENKQLGTNKSLKPFTFKRDQLLDIQRRITGPAAWRKIRIGVQSDAIRQFKALQTKFYKELFHIANDLNNQTSSLAQAEKLSKDLFNSYYNRAYALGAKASGAGITLGYKAKNALPALYKQEEQWSKTAAQQERKFWTKFLGQVDAYSTSFPNPAAKNAKKNAPITYTPPHFTLPQRVSMYVDSLESHFDAGRVAGSQNHAIIFWHTAKKDTPCPTCIWLEANSPWPKELLVTTPKAGLCPCRHNCRCSLTIVPKTAKEYMDLKKDKPNKTTIYNRLRKALK